MQYGPDPNVMTTSTGLKSLKSVSHITMNLLEIS